ncbi:glycoside hydrolase family 28 protein [Flavivirga eckloniae]|uniref:Glycoside hydrolase n=1 Tax=Flavivirga eckloniae TaxID=1803846 RepID=A0A2K9PU24_9FLAO|nr:glycosyl hydrolase family 28 protein [Flavivirga eckloniae]AUP80539.1 glycoside hydrolase [Flavivirga eckloniae]
MKNCYNLFILFVLGVCSQMSATEYNVMAFGAKGDGITKDTKAVQDAINACSTNGGGTVLIPAGKTVVIGTIYIKDFVTLHVENGAVLMGSPDIEDYTTDTHKNMYKNEPHMDRCLIFAKNAKSFALEGYGTIDGNGHPKNFTNKVGRPMLMRFMNCQDIHLKNLTIKNPAAWVSAWLYCDEIVVDGIRIHSRVNHNGDGLDFDGCTNVRVSNSSFDTSDDSICIQASLISTPSKNIVVTNCTFKSKWAGMRIGLLSRGDIESVTVSNCTFNDIQDSGLKIQLNEGGEMKNMTFSNLVMNNVPRPIFMTFAQQKACVDAPEEMYPMKAMHDFIFNGMVVDNSKADKNSAIFITGMPEHDITDIQLSNIQFTVSGGGTAKDANKDEIKEYTLETLSGWWPEFHLVGTLPAYGIYARHINGLLISNVQINTVEKDERPPIVFDDVKNAYINSVYSNRKIISENDLIKR